LRKDLHAEGGKRREEEGRGEGRGEGGRGKEGGRREGRGRGGRRMHVLVPHGPLDALLRKDLHVLVGEQPFWQHPIGLDRHFGPRGRIGNRQKKSFHLVLILLLLILLP
jgi:hypothetical protein